MPDLVQRNLQPWEQRPGIEAGVGLEALGIATATGGPHLHRLLLGNQQPAELGAMGLISDVLRE